MSVFPARLTFARGEISPKLHARSDIEHYAQGLADATNWQVMRQGGLTRRAGFKFIAPCRDESVKGRLLTFEFSEQQGYAIILNGGYIRFATAGGQVVLATQSITGITKANPAVVTYSGADTYANGDRVFIIGVVGMTEVNNREFTVANVSGGANTFELSGVNSTGYTTYSSAGSIAEIYEIVSPYATADLFGIQIAQAGDTVYFAHPDYPQYKLVRTSETSWAITAIAFEDGPWLEENTQGTYMTAASGGRIVPVMTNNTSPSGTASDDDATAQAYLAFDGVQMNGHVYPGTAGWIAYDIAGAGQAVCDAYWLGAPHTTPDRMPTAWTVEGYTGAAWIVLDTRTGESGWTTGERRYYEFPNKTLYDAYRFYWTAVDGSPNYSYIGCIVFHESGDTQTAFNLTASSTTGINGSTGFQTTDVGRTIRLLGQDGVWRWARIIVRTSTTVVTIRLYGQGLLTDSLRIGRWQLSAWSASDGYATGVSFYQDRLCWGGSDTQPRTVFPSKSADYENMGISDPPVDNDGIEVAITGGTFSKISWLAEADELVIGTAAAAAAIQPLAVQSAGMRLMGPADSSAAFSSSNIRVKQSPPILLYVDRYKKQILEYAFSTEGGGYGSRELSILSEHLFQSMVIEGAFQDSQEDNGWWVMNDGTLVCLTYDASQSIAGFVPVEVAGGGSANAVVESVCPVPASGGAALYALVKRTINSATHRYVEYLTPRYETGDTLADFIYFDAAFAYSGALTSTVSGLNWLIGETIGLLVNGVDVGDAVVSSAGTVTSPTAGTKINGGKRYTSRGETLRAAQVGNQDGSPLGRRKRTLGLGADILNTAGLSIGTLIGTRRANDTPDTLTTGIFPLGPVDDSWRNGGVIVFSTNKGYPATIRAIAPMIDAEP